MKKILSLILCVLMMVSVLAACGEKAPEAANLKFGLGVNVPAASVADATADKDGSASVDATYAAVSVDADGKIVAVALDTMQHKITFTAEGKTAKGEFKSKYELGADYGMVAYGGATKEWYEQADAFKSVVIGKTLDEVKALATEDGKGVEAVVNAGCTMSVAPYVNAIEEAYNNAKESNVTADHTLKIAAATEQSVADATADKEGSNEINTTIFAAAVDAEGKVVAAISDCLQVKVGFDTAGKCTFDASKEILTKREKGDDYGMVAYGGSAKEWYAQADAFDAACVGKTGAEIAKLMGEDGKAVADVQSAGCTIYVSGFVAAASKI